MTYKEELQGLIKQFYLLLDSETNCNNEAFKQCALISLRREHSSNKNLLDSLQAHLTMKQFLVVFAGIEKRYRGIKSEIDKL